MFNPGEWPNVDPTESSILSPTEGELIKVGEMRNGPYKTHQIMEDRFGNRFYGGESFDVGASQMLLARILKGIIPASDVITHESNDGQDYYYSYEMPLVRTEKESGEFSADDMIYVDIFILKHVFGDEDHYISNFGEFHNNIRRLANEYILFDFGNFKHFWDSYWAMDDYNAANFSYLKDLSPSQIKFLDLRINSLLQRFNGSKGLEFLRDVVNSIPSKPSVISDAPGDDQVLTFYKTFVRRLKIIDRMLKDHKKAN